MNILTSRIKIKRGFLNLFLNVKVTFNVAFLHLISCVFKLMIGYKLNVFQRF